ncbi:MAG: peroxiredoxin [Methylococcales bacterium]|jgi:uncharacterized protein|nr:peroxiredoxin [Methylococcales bacterium]MBT7444769.1 peroxiredoxin [Methylococcales bacterium]
MSKKMLFVMAIANPSNPLEVFVPLSQSSVAAAMGYEVELIFTGCSGELAKPDFAKTIIIPAQGGKTAYDLIKEGYDAGVVYKVCSPMLALWGDDVISEVTEVIGAAYVISESMEGESVVFTY